MLTDFILKLRQLGVAKPVFQAWFVTSSKQKAKNKSTGFFALVDKTGSITKAKSLKSVEGSLEVASTRFSSFHSLRIYHSTVASFLSLRPTTITQLLQNRFLLIFHSCKRSVLPQMVETTMFVNENWSHQWFKAFMEAPTYHKSAFFNVLIIQQCSYTIPSSSSGYTTPILTMENCMRTLEMSLSTDNGGNQFIVFRNPFSPPNALSAERCAEI